LEYLWICSNLRFSLRKGLDRLFILYFQDDTQYYTAAMINIIIFFIAIGLMFAYAIAMMILKFLKNRKQTKEV